MVSNVRGRKIAVSVVVGVGVKAITTHQNVGLSGYFGGYTYPQRKPWRRMLKSRASRLLQKSGRFSERKNLRDWYSSSAGKVKAHSPCNPLPVPDSRPITLVHQCPDFFENLQDPVAISQTGIATNSFNRVSHALSLSCLKAGSADNHAWNEKECLCWVRRLEALK